MENGNTVDISIIIPCYNVEEYLEECLQSVADSKGSFIKEVILVDDGATDSTGEIAKNFADSHEDFFYYHKENGGLGNARNYGLQFAHGKYLAYLDSDDIVAEDMYQNMWSLAESSGSELTICNVVRFNSKRTIGSVLHKRLFNSLPLDAVTSVHENHDLIYDTTSWNKLILRSFYQSHGFKWPEKILFEDIPVTIPMHCEANHVAVVRKVGYFWRTRDGVSKSITQMNSNMKNLEDRLKILDMLYTYFRQHPEYDHSLFEHVKVKTLKTDLRIYVDQCKDLDLKQSGEYISRLKKFIEDNIDTAFFDRLTALEKQIYVAVMDGDAARMKDLLTYGRQQYSYAALKEEEGRYSLELPKKLFPEQYYDGAREFDSFSPRHYIDKMCLLGDVLTIDAHAYLWRVNVPETGDQKVSAYLVNNVKNTRIPLELTQFKNSELTDTVGSIYNYDQEAWNNYNYDGSFFKIKIDLSALPLEALEEGGSYIGIEFENKLVRKTFGLDSLDKTTRLAAGKYRYIREDRLIFMEFDGNNLLMIKSICPKELIRQVSTADGKLHLSCDTDVEQLYAVSDEEKIKLDRDGDKKYILDLAKLEDGSYEIMMENIEARKSLAETLDNTFSSEDVEDSDPADLLDEMEEYISIPCPRIDSFLALGDKQALVFSDIESRLLIRKSDYVTEVTEITEENRHVLIRTKIHGANPEKHKGKIARLIVDDMVGGENVILAEASVTINGDNVECCFDIDLNHEELFVNFYQSRRNIMIEYAEGEAIIRQKIYGTKTAEFIFRRDDMEVLIHNREERYFVLVIYRKWLKEDNTAAKRKAISMVEYPLMRNQALDDKVIVFESMWGRQYSCNPRALYEYIDQNHPEYTCVWSLNDPHIPIKGNGIRVRRGSKVYYEYLAKAKYFVNNVNFADSYVKRPGQIEIQTMHGTPYKSLGLDVPGDFPTPNSVWKYIRKNERWNYLIVQGEFSEKLAWRWFRFHKTFLCTGYPRTDELYAGKDMTEVKKKLGLPENKRILLYAPTWRVSKHFDMQLDLEAMKKELSDDYVIAVRLHHLAVGDYKVPADNKFVFDLTQYSNMDDLYHIADCVVTDYSSVMFDFAMTGKPMIFYTYDYEEYTKELRGVYFDLKKEAPGPLVATTEEVIAEVKELDSLKERYADRIKLFNNKYLTYERPDSCEEIFRQVFEEGRRSTSVKAYEGITSFGEKMLPGKVTSLAEKVKVHLMAKIK